jgi:hypothetical protein
MAKEIVVNVLLSKSGMREFEKSFKDGLVKSSERIQEVIKDSLKGDASGKILEVKNRMGLIPQGIYNWLRTNKNWRLINERESRIKVDSGGAELTFPIKSKEDVDRIARELQTDSSRLVAKSIDQLSKASYQNFSLIFKTAMEKWR